MSYAAHTFPLMYPKMSAVEAWLNTGTSNASFTTTFSSGLVKTGDERSRESDFEKDDEENIDEAGTDEE